MILQEESHTIGLLSIQIDKYLNDQPFQNRTIGNPNFKTFSIPICLVSHNRYLSPHCSPLFRSFFPFRFNGLFAPYWRSDARGMMIGLTQFTTKDHICRATLEAVAFQVNTFFTSHHYSQTKDF